MPSKSNQATGPVGASLRIAAIIPVHNRKQTTLHFLEQFERVDKGATHVDVIVVDDGSSDGTSDAIRAKFPETTLLKGNGSLWWTGAVRLGVDYALRGQHDYVLLMNDDLEIDQDFLIELLKVSDVHPNALVSSTKLHRKPNGTEEILTAGFNVSGILQEIQHVRLSRAQEDKVIECDVLSGASLLIPIKVFEAIGPFDNKRFPHGFGDYDFTWRASRAGFRCLVATCSKISTDRNPKYEPNYFLRSTRIDYLRNAFSYPRYSYGFLSLWSLARMRTNPFVAGFYYLRRVAGLTTRMFLKAILPNRVLCRLYRRLEQRT